MPLMEYLSRGGLRADIAAHRRWGKDEVALHHACAASQLRKGVYWHMLPQAAQARKAIWDAVNPHSGKRRIDEAFPLALRAQTRDEDMKITFRNGSVWQVVGSDNYDALVGSPPVGVVFSEWALAKPAAWTYLRPILAENGGWAVFLWTPRGRNHAVVSFEARARDANWFTMKSPATQTDVFTPQQLAKERAELIAECGSQGEGEARFASEYLVEFDAPAPGAYYGEALKAAADEGRIGKVPYDRALKVETAWDLGIADYTAIWFFQSVGREVRAIDYFETSGEGLPAIMRQAIAAKPYVYGHHYLPHDVMVREMTAGRSRYETLSALGLASIVVGVAANPLERVHAGRLLIPQMWFDAQKCAVGLDRLRAYRKGWNRQTHSYVGPVHDSASHGADAFGEFAVNRRGVAPAQAGGRIGRGEGGWMG